MKMHAAVKLQPNYKSWGGLQNEIKMVYAQNQSSGMGATTTLHDAQVRKQSIANGIIQSEPSLIFCAGYDISRAPPRQQSREMLPRGGGRGF